MIIIYNSVIIFKLEKYSYPGHFFGKKSYQTPLLDMNIYPRDVKDKGEI